jgi:hypothetical protein
MGYYSQYSLHAIHPKSLGSITMTTWPEGFRRTVQQELSELYGSRISVDFATGSLFAGERVKFYENDEAMRHLSQQCPQAIWVLHIDGEEPGDRRALYAYRGVTYVEKEEPWVPPPPNMKRLPSVDEDLLDVDPDPPTVIEALELSLRQAGHDLECSSRDISPNGSDDYRCDCWRSKVVAVVKHQRGLHE